MKLFIYFFVFLASFNVLADESVYGTVKNLPMPLPPAVGDSMFFDLNNSVFTSALGLYYVDIPIYIKTVINPSSFDFWFKFNEAKMTYNSTVSLISALDTYTYFSVNDHFLRNTTSGPSISYQVPNNTPLLMVRFLLADGCTSVDTSDFSEITTLLDGLACNHKILYTPTSSGGTTTLPTTYCTNSGVNLSFPASVNGQTITSWSWDFANGTFSNIQNPTAVFLVPQTYPVSINVSTAQGCNYSFIQNITVFNTPVSNFSYSIDLAMDSVFFYNNIPSSSLDTLTWSWNFGDAGLSSVENPSHHYISGGYYSVSLASTTNHGCSDTLVELIFIDKPTAAFSTTGACAGSVISFLDASVYSMGTITSWQWDFGDGTTSTVQNPSHIYSFSGSYTVNLTVTTPSGSFGNTSNIVVISSTPLVQFLGDALTGCSPMLVNFSNLSVSPAGSSYLWNFGDNSTSSSQTPSHTYLQSGVFPVKLVVTSLSGCSDSLIKPAYITVGDAATANFTSTGGCANTLINFIDNSTITGGSIISWNWSFGDGGISSSQNPTHIYSTPGSYLVTLSAINNVGCAGTLSQTIIINAIPIVQFTTVELSGCAPLSVNFQNLSTAVAGTSYLWSFGDGLTASNQNPTHVYTNDGVFDVSLLVTAPGGCTDSLNIISYINVLDAVQANFSETNRCANAATIFSDLSTISNGTISAWSWNFGNGSSSTNQNPTFVYLTPGTYVVSLNVLTNQGCSNTIVKNVTIDNKPVADFTVNDSVGCGSLLALFTDLSSTPINSTYAWNFGDSQVSSVKNPSHTFSINGSYTITEVVTSPGGCMDSISKINYISIQTAPTASFVASTDFALIPNAIIDFTSESANYSSLNWDFGDSYFSNLQSPSHNFIDTGQFVVCLTAFSSFGCTDTSCMEVKISASNKIAVPSAFSPNGDGYNDVFLIEGGPFLEIEIKIMNEWGNQIFVSSSQNEGWDGKYNNVLQPNGAYEYIISGKTLDNQPISKYGIVNLTR